MDFPRRDIGIEASILSSSSLVSGEPRSENVVVGRGGVGICAETTLWDDSDCERAGCRDDLRRNVLDCLVGELSTPKSCSCDEVPECKRPDRRGGEELVRAVEGLCGDSLRLLLAEGMRSSSSEP